VPPRITKQKHATEKGKLQLPVLTMQQTIQQELLPTHHHHSKRRW
jgi:hypothetical protein